jgi:nucleoside-diphosphate-sugar epimerase
MKNLITITGGTGFVGKNLSSYLNRNKNIESDLLNLRLQNPIILSKETKVVVHLAGKAHDTKKVINPDDFYSINTELTKKVYDAFLDSNADIFIFLSSVKAVADKVDSILTEEFAPMPQTTYGKSKLLAEQYIFSKPIPNNKKVYVLRPCMIHGYGNKGNLNLLYQLVSKKIPWPLGSFENKRSFCSIDNLCFIINELINSNSIPNGIYNIADNDPISTNEIIKLIAKSQNKRPKIFCISPKVVKLFARLGDFLKLPLNSDRLEKLTESFIVSNKKISDAIGKPLPISAKDGLIKTIQSFKKDVQ